MSPQLCFKYTPFSQKMQEANINIFSDEKMPCAKNTFVIDSREATKPAIVLLIICQLNQPKFLFLATNAIYETSEFRRGFQEVIRIEPGPFLNGK